MNRALLSIVGCLGAIGFILTTGRIANPDTAKVIPYPEVLNLKRVPIFNDKGMVAQAIAPKVLSPVKIATRKLPEQYSSKKVRQLILEHQNLAKIAIDR